MKKIYKYYNIFYLFIINEIHMKYLLRLIVIYIKKKKAQKKIK